MPISTFIRIQIQIQIILLSQQMQIQIQIMVSLHISRDINEYTDSVAGYIPKCMKDVVPKITKRSFPN